MGRIMGLEMEISVHVHGLPVDKDVQAAILSSEESEGECPQLFFLLHGNEAKSSSLSLLLEDQRKTALA